jgi:ATP-binding cassette, subfamily C, bacterial LapB
MQIENYLTCFKSVNFKQNFEHLSKQDLFVGLILSSCLINLLGLVLPFTIIQMYDRVIPNKSYNTFAAFLVIVLVVLIIESILKIMRGFISSSLDVKLGYVMSKYAYKTAVNSDLISFEQDPFGMQIDRFNFINSLKEYYSGQYLIAMCDAPFVIIYFIFCYCIQMYVGLSVTVVCLILLAISYLQAIKLKANHFQKTKDSQIISKFLIELFGGLGTIKTLGLEEQMLRRYERLQKNHVQKEFELIQEKMATSKNIVISSQIVVITAAVVGCCMIFKNHMTVGGMSACILLAGKVMQPVASLINLIIKLKHFSIAKQEFNKLTNYKQENTDNCKKIFISNGEIKLNNINFFYTDQLNNKISIFENLEFTVPAKKIIAIHGNRLSGKSTLINILACLFRGEGTVEIDGENINNLDLDHLRKQIALISEKTTLFQGNILENLSGCSNIAPSIIQDVCVKIGLHNIIQAMPNGYQTVVGTEDSLARGVKQLIIIARELIKNPKIILFDEVSIDLEIDLMMKQIINLNKGRITMVIVSTRPSLLYMADEHYFIKNKKIIKIF